MEQNIMVSMYTVGCADHKGVSGMFAESAVAQATADELNEQGGCTYSVFELFVEANVVWELAVTLYEATEQSGGNILPPYPEMN